MKDAIKKEEEYRLSFIKSGSDEDKSLYIESLEESDYNTPKVKTINIKI